MTRGRSIAATLVLLALLGATLALVLPASSAAGKGFFGVSAAQELTTRDYNTMRKAGVASLRFGIAWPNVQTQRGPCKSTSFQPPDNYCNWAGTDAIVTELAKRNITPLVDIGGTPEWANHRNGFYAQRYTPLETKAGRSGWIAFLHAAAGRYGPHGTFWQANPAIRKRPIKIWQIWNEQNSSNAFRPRASAAAYGALLKVSAKALRSSEPKAKIMLGGMFGTPGGGGAQAVTAWKFLGQLLKKNQVRKSFDYVALHPYSPTIGGIKFQLKKLRRVLRSKHDAKAQIWITELGWGSDAKHVHNHLVFSPKKQKAMLVKAFKLLLHERKPYNIGGVIWYSWRDPGPGSHTCNFCLSSGLLKQSYQPKPAYKAFKKFAPGP